MWHTVPLTRADLLGRQQYFNAFQDRAPNDLRWVGNQLKINYQLANYRSSHSVGALWGNCKTLLDWEKNGNTTQVNQQLQPAHQFYEGKHHNWQVFQSFRQPPLCKHSSSGNSYPPKDAMRLWKNVLGGFFGLNHLCYVLLFSLFAWD